MRGSIVHLQPGEQLSFPIEKVEVVRAIASTLKLAMSRLYKTKSDKAAGIVTITRIN
ncbi:MAG: hypothetical protein NC453_18165 [Muribaculum sp.]|nr:hypothetical protein [Muribaculum sp.]